MNANRDTPWGTKVIVRYEMYTMPDGVPDEITYRGWFLGANVEAPERYCAVQAPEGEIEDWEGQILEIDFYNYGCVFVEDWVAENE